MKNKFLRITVLRSFLVQSSMNFERMHNIGITYILLPSLKAIYSNDQHKLRNALKRHLEFYNCHPYMSAFVLGVTIKLEEKLARGELDNPEMISQVKNGMMGPLSAMGDLFFWKSLRPMVAIISVAFAVQGYLYAPIIFLVLYNIPHLYIRCAGVFMGYAEGIKVINKIQSVNINKLVALMTGIAVFYTGVLFSSVIKWEFNDLHYGWQGATLFLAIIGLKKSFKVIHLFIIIMILVFVYKLFL